MNALSSHDSPDSFPLTLYENFCMAPFSPKNVQKNDKVCIGCKQAGKRDSVQWFWVIDNQLSYLEDGGVNNSKNSGLWSDKF